MDAGKEWWELVCWSIAKSPRANDLPRRNKAIVGSLGDLTTRIAKIAKTGVRILPNPTAVIGPNSSMTNLGIIPVLLVYSITYLTDFLQSRRFVS